MVDIFFFFFLSNFHQIFTFRLEIKVFGYNKFRDGNMTKVKKKKKLKLKLNNIFVLLSIITSLLLIYQISQLGPIEPVIRGIVVLILLTIDFIFFYYKKNLKRFLALFVMFVFVSINLFAANLIGEAYGSLNSINKKKITYSSYLVAKNDSTVNTIEDVTELKIGMLNDTLSIDNYIIAKELIEENKLDKDNTIQDYDDVAIMLHDLYNHTIDAMLISSNYKEMFSTTEGYENIADDLKVIASKDKDVDKDEIESVNTEKSVNKPFTVLLMGVDSEKDGLKKNAYANGDSLILLTFNPDTYNTTMMSIPRDSYLPIACKNNKRNKLTHAGWYGTECMMQTIENTFDINIDYYVKINFKGVVNLVDALGGVEVEVPKRLCTDDSNRQGTLCIDKGVQLLDGEHALVFARNRYDLAQGDIDRGYNQQTIIKAMINKMTTIRNINTILDILETVSNNLDTNLTTNEILSFYNVFKEIITSTNYQDGDALNIEQLRLKGSGKMIYYSNLKQKLWNYILDEDSIEEVSKTMKINLGLQEPEMIKSFHFEP